MCIVAEHLSYTYNERSPFETAALHDVTLTIEGEFFGIIGHTGSGKSTFVQHLNGLIRLPSSLKHAKKRKAKKGQPLPPAPVLKVGEFDLSDKKTDFRALRRHVGMVFQYPEYQLFAETVRDDVAFGLKNFSENKLTEEEIDSAVCAALEVVGLNFDELKEQSPFELSGGQKRRVAIAGVIVSRPEILILDEPAAGLDPLGKKEILELLHRLHREWCKTVVIVSHDMDEISENCTRAAVFSEGTVKYVLPPKELFRRTEELTALGLDVPLTAKLCAALKARGIDIDCDFTTEDFADKVLAYAASHPKRRATHEDVTFGQYYPRDSFVHRLDPRMKFLFLIAYIVAIFLATNFYGLAVCTAVLIVIIALARIPFGKVLRSIRGILVLLVFTALLNILFVDGETVYAQWWIFVITREGLLFAALLSLRLVLLVLCSSMLTFTTTPVSLTDGVESLLTPLKWIKLPVHALALVMSIALRMIPVLMDEVDRIKNAQRARGADLDRGGLMHKIRTTIPILVPLVLSALRRADELGDAMDARCYMGDKHRTKYKKLHFTWRDLLAFLVGAALITGVVLLRIYLPAPF